MSSENLEKDFSIRLKQIEAYKEEGVLKDVEPYYEISILLSSNLINKAKLESKKKRILLQEAVIDIVRNPIYDFLIVDPTDEIVDEMDRLNSEYPQESEHNEDGDEEESDYAKALLYRAIEVDVHPWSDEDTMVGRYMLTEHEALYNKFVL